MKPLSDITPCGRRPSFLVKRVLPGALLVVCLLHVLWTADHHGRPSVWLAGFAVAATFLGACIWWVAQRQTSPSAALLVLSLYAGGLALRPNLLALLPALGLFAMLYTGLGMAHALSGPPKKWLPRIAMLAAEAAFTGWAQPLACSVGLMLALCGGLYLVDLSRRRVLLPLFAVWALAGTVAGQHALNRMPVRVFTPWWSLAGVGLAFLVALGLWLASKRSRFFGNSAPLIACVVLLFTYLLIGPESLLWALPHALIFIAGVFADGFESRHRRVWLVGAQVLAFGQIGLCAWFLVHQWQTIRQPILLH